MEPSWVTYSICSGTLAAIPDTFPPGILLAGSWHADAFEKTVVLVGVEHDDARLVVRAAVARRRNVNQVPVGLGTRPRTALRADVAHRNHGDRAGRRHHRASAFLHDKLLSLRCVPVRVYGEMRGCCGSPPDIILARARVLFIPRRTRHATLHSIIRDGDRGHDFGHEPCGVDRSESTRACRSAGRWAQARDTAAHHDLVGLGRRRRHSRQVHRRRGRPRHRRN